MDVVLFLIVFFLWVVISPGSLVLPQKIKKIANSIDKLSSLMFDACNLPYHLFIRLHALVVRSCFFYFIILGIDLLKHDAIFDRFTPNGIHFEFKGCWVVSFSFIQVLKVHSVSKQNRT